MTTVSTIVIDRPGRAQSAGLFPSQRTGLGPARAGGQVPAQAGGRYAALPVGSVAVLVDQRTGHGLLSTGGAAVENLLRQRAELSAGHPDRVALRERAIEAGLALSRSLAARYAERGEPLDDLRQVAALGLIKAVDGYDPARSVPFASYAVPTITGAIKRHFRDTTWRIRVPRRIQELALTIAPTSADLAQRLGRSPTLTELAAQLGTAERDIAVASNVWTAHRPVSLDAAAGNGDLGGVALVDTLGFLDARLDAVTDQQVWRRLLAALPPRERRVLALRFGGDLTQAEIAARIGVSQMQVSRLLLRALTALRSGLRPVTPACPIIPARAVQAVAKGGRRAYREIR
jgi:RNA polymerase sigma-B factor